MKKNFIILLVLSGAILTSCSTVNTNNAKPAAESEVYVFDDASDLNEEIEEEPKETVNEVSDAKFIVQIGAFSTKARAENFKKRNSSKVSYDLNISYSSKVGLFVVQLPAFETRAEAEKVRNSLWKSNTFRDAFILIKK